MRDVWMGIIILVTWFPNVSRTGKAWRNGLMIHSMALQKESVAPKGSFSQDAEQVSTG